MTSAVPIAQALIVAFAISLSPFAKATDISGVARVVDGDTLRIGTQTIRLYGIDAPESGQDCLRKNGSSYNCGELSEKALKALVRKKTSCSGTEFDNYDRLIAICRAEGVEINRELVRKGYALAFRKFSEKYIADEQMAEAATVGMWAGSFETPADFRAKRWQSAVTSAPSPDCPIKGNINRNGERIYHAPWSRSYERTRINTSKSERWFCTEAEALAAGWRAPYR